MATDPQPVSKPVIEDNIRRTVERTTLRKIRGVLAELGRQEQEGRRFGLGIYAVCGSGLVADLVRRRAGPALRIGWSPMD
jgi:hypothetical protein